eukprot:520073-Prorocentrum_minimum.AAC.1
MVPLASPADRDLPGDPSAASTRGDDSGGGLSPSTRGDRGASPGRRGPFKAAPCAPGRGRHRKIRGRIEFSSGERSCY